MKRIFFIALMALTISGYSQISFVTKYGNSGYDFARDVKQDVDTGYVVTGSSSSFSAEDSEAFILKLDSLGNFMWSFNYGAEGSEWGEEIVVTNDSSYAIAGYSNSAWGNGGFDFYIVRAAADGSPIWEKTYGGSDWDKAYCLVELADSGFVVVGESYSFNNMRSGYIIRIDKNGDTLWTHVENNPVPSFFRSVDLDGDSIVVCGGIGDGGVDTHNGYVVKMDMNGQVSWTHIVGQGYDDYFNSIKIVDTVYSLGGVRSYDYANDKEDVWIYRLEDDGTLISDLTYVNPTPANDAIHDIEVRDFDQEFQFVGETSSYGYLADGLADVFMCKVTWTNVFIGQGNAGHQGADIGWGIDRCTDGGVVVCGDSKYQSTGGYNLFVMKLDGTWQFPNWDTEMGYDSITTSIYDQANILPLNFYPNPVRDILYFNQSIQGVVLIHDLTGKLHHEGVISGNALNLQFLVAGTYVLTVVNEEGIKQEKIIKL